MESILKPFDLLKEQDGAGTGTWLRCSGPPLRSVSPVNGRQVGAIRSAAAKDCETVVSRAAEAFKTWRAVPAPRRGEIVRQIGDALRNRKKELGALVSLETGKIRSEGEGEVQEMIDTDATAVLQAAVAQVEEQGGRVLYGGSVLKGGLYDAGTYVTPCICEARADLPLVQAETFAPLLYLVKYDRLEEAVAYHNAVPQGLSSANFTRDIRESEYFLSARGSDCGIANVNIGTSGAEIGGAFGGEKETGGGRESGSDAWKAYMRHQTCTANWSDKLPLAQGIAFDAG